MELRKVSETGKTITLGWSPPAGVGGYVLYAAGQAVSVATTNLKDGTPRKEARFSKTNPGPPFQVAAVTRAPGGAVALDLGTYPPAKPLPSNVAESSPTAQVTV